MYKFSQGASNVMMMADRISNSANCNYKGTEHILAGILSTDCVARKILLASGVNSENFFEVFKETIDYNYSVNGYTPRAKNMFETANSYAIMTNGGYISSEHLLL
ncbi:MAG: Clp protease N-terminal domain-containing protein, partial [Clostridia bacterium]